MRILGGDRGVMIVRILGGDKNVTTVIAVHLSNDGQFRSSRSAPP